MQTNQLNQARNLDLPSREAMLHRAPSVQQFWTNHYDLLSDAWKEWEVSNSDTLATLDSSLLDKRLRDAVEHAWADPSKELAVQDLMLRKELAGQP